MKVSVSFKICTFHRPRFFKEYNEITLYYTNPFNSDSREFIEYTQMEDESDMEFFERMYKKISDINWVKDAVQEDLSLKSPHLKNIEDVRKLKENIGNIVYSVEVEIQ